MPESVIDSPDLEVQTHCSGLCLGGLSIWPDVRRGSICPYGLKNKHMYLPLKNVQDSFLFYFFSAFSFFHVSQTV